VTPQWQRFTLSTKVPSTDSKARVQFGFGDGTCTVWLDDVRVQEGNPNVWRRPYSNGVAVVNSTNSAMAVPLGGLYRCLQGTQAPGVNGGRLVNSVTVAAHDGIIAVKPDLGRVSASLNPGYSNAVLAARYTHSVATYYSKKSKHGSRSARRKAAKAYVAWKNAAASADGLCHDLSAARSWVKSGDARLADSVIHAEANVAKLISRVAGARKLGRAPRAAASAPAAAAHAKIDVQRVAVSSR
jgi:hypothetical protein